MAIRNHAGFVCIAYDSCSLEYSKQQLQYTAKTAITKSALLEMIDMCPEHHQITGRRFIFLPLTHQPVFLRFRRPGKSADLPASGARPLGESPGEQGVYDDQAFFALTSPNVYRF